MTVLVLFVASLVIRWACLAITWTEAAWAHSQMLRGVARAKHAHRLSLRSHTPDGSGTGDPDPNRSPVQAGVEIRAPAQTVVSPPATYVAPCRCDEADAAVSPSVRHLTEGLGLSAVVPAFPRALPPSPGGRDSVVPPDSRGHRAPQTPAGAVCTPAHKRTPRPLDLHTH